MNITDSSIMFLYSITIQIKHLIHKKQELWYQVAYKNKQQNKVHNINMKPELNKNRKLYITFQRSKITKENNIE